MGTRKLTNFKLQINRIFTGSIWQQLSIMLIIILIAIAILCIVWCCFCVESKVVIQSFFNSDFGWKDWEHATGERLFRPIISILGAVLFSGFLISLLTNALQNKQTKIKAGAEEYHLHNHIVIIGFDETIPAIIQQLVLSDKYKDSLILLQSSIDSNLIKDKIHSKLLNQEEHRIVYMHSLHPSKEDLQKLHTVDAREIYVIGDRTQNDHDSENMHIVHMLYQIHKEANAQQKPMTVWFESEVSYAALRLNDIKKAWNDLFDFMPYNFYKDWANRLLSSSHYHRGRLDIIKYPEMDHDGINKNSSKHVHVVIVGMNRMGTAIANEVAHLLHFPNFNEQEKTNQTIITFIDDQADKEMQFFKGRHPGYFDIEPTYYCDATTQLEVTFLKQAGKKDEGFLDIRFEFLKGRIEHDNVRQWLISQAMDTQQYLNVVICLHNPSKSLGSGLYLPEELYREDTTNKRYTNIFIRQETSSSLVEALRETANSEKAENKKYKHVYPFGMISNSMDIECMDFTKAQAINYIYAYYFKHDKSLPPSLPAPEQLKKQWQQLSISKQWSNIYLADSFEFKLRSFGYNIYSNNPLCLSDDDKQQMARVEHNRWNMEKLLLGYRAMNSEEKKQLQQFTTETEKDNYVNLQKDAYFVHHNIQPFSDLDEDTKKLDLNIVETLPMVLQYSTTK